VPEWYFLPFYAILRSIPDKLGGVVAMFAAILILFVLPFLVKGEVRSACFRPMYRGLFWFFLVDTLLLAWVGGNEVKYPFYELGQFCTIFYFVYFSLLLPICCIVEAYLWKKELV
jgi:ubiquinol-cytochrome c reductase cytochrome b subunit